MPRYQDSILHIICASHEHLNAEQIFWQLKKEYPKVVQATVYNNLHALQKAGKIRRIPTEDGPDCYDENTKHDHLCCSICHELSDVDLPDFKAQIEQALGHSIESYDLKIHWICSKCRHKDE